MIGIRPGNFMCLVTATLLGVSVFGSGSSAQTTAPAPQASSRHEQPAQAQRNPQTTKQRTDEIEAKIAQLRAQLKITPSEANLWNPVARMIRDNELQLSKLVTERNEKAPTMSAVENLRNYQRIVDTRADGLKRLTPVFDKLYDAMSASQKKNADMVFRKDINARLHSRKSSIHK